MVGIGLRQGGEEADGGDLAGTIGAEDTEDGILINGEILASMPPLAGLKTLLGIDQPLVIGGA